LPELGTYGDDLVSTDPSGLVIIAERRKDELNR
jgi:hypothetical protein